MSKAELLLLVDEGDGAGLRDAADRTQELDVAALLQPALQRRVRVEVVLDRAAASGNDDDDLLDPRGEGLFHGVLDDRPVDERHDLLRDRLGGGQETGSEAGRRQDGLSDARGDAVSPLPG